MFSHFSTRLMNKNHRWLLRASMGLLFPLLVCIVVVFGSSTAALAHPIPVGDGESVVTPAQQCLDASLFFYDKNPKDPTHSAVLVLEVTNRCPINILLTDYELYTSSTCPATNESPVSIMTTRFPHQPILKPGGHVLDVDIHTNHCVFCDEMFKPSGWPAFTVDVSLLDVSGINADRNDGLAVYAAPHVQGSFSYSLSNGPSVGDAERCLGRVP